MTRLLLVVLTLLAVAVMSCGDSDLEAPRPTVGPTKTPRPTVSIPTAAPRSLPTPMPTLTPGEAIQDLVGPSPDCARANAMSDRAKLNLWNAHVTAQDRAVERVERTGGRVDYAAIKRAIAVRFNVSINTVDCIRLEGQMEWWPLPPTP